MSSMNETGLSELLHDATEDLPARDLVASAWAQGRVVRRRRRAGVVAGVVALVATAVAVPMVVAGGGSSGRPEPAPPAATSPSTEDEVGVATLPVWDPFTLADAPRGESVLPEVVAPPERLPPDVLDNPLPAAVLAWPEEGRDLMLLGTDGEWRCVPGTADAVTGTLDDVLRPSLSSDGHRVAMATNDGVLVVDVTEGTQQLLPWPDEIAAPSDTIPDVAWMPGEQTVLVHHWKGGWLLGLDGSAAPAPYDAAYPPPFVDPDGPVRQHLFDDRLLVEWDGDRRVDEVPTDWWGERYATRFGLVGFTGAVGGRRAGPVVVSADDARVVAYAPTRDRASVYSDNGYLSVIGFLDPSTALVKVAPMSFRTMDLGEETWHLVAWDFESGEFSTLTQGATGMRRISVAVDAVR